MKDYDAERAKLQGLERTFPLCGIEFTAAPTMPARALSDLADVQSGATTSRLYDTVVEIIVATLRADSRKPFEELLAREDLDVPIDMQTLLNIANDLCEVATGRPTLQPLPSNSTPERTQAASTGGSGLQAAAASTTSRSGPA